MLKNLSDFLDGDAHLPLRPVFCSLLTSLPRRLASLATLAVFALLALAPVAVFAADSSSDYTVNGQPGTLNELQIIPTSLSGNTVTVTDGSKTNPSGVFGAKGTGSITGNTVTMSGGTVTLVYGGYAEGDSDAAVGNTVNFSGGTIAGTMIGGFGFEAINGNTVNMTGGAVNSIIGGNGITSIFNNIVNIRGGDVTTYVSGGQGLRGNITGNIVNISGGTIGSYIVGGYGNNRVTVNVTDNVVNISGGTIQTASTTAGSNYIAGAYVGPGGGSATGNTVSVSGSPIFNTDITHGTVLYGGYQPRATTPATDLRTGNTLNVLTSGITVRNIANFQNYNFAMSPTSGTTLTLTDTTNTVFAAGDVVRVVQVNGRQRLAVGHSNTLLAHTGTGVLSGLTAAMLPSGHIQQGASLLYDYALTESADHKSLTATITGVQAAPQGKAVSEGRAAALGYALLGADLVAGAGMDNARMATTAMPAGKGLSGGSAGGMGLMPFFAMSASSMRYNSGSYTDVNGMALMAGLAKKWEAPAADVLLGAFFEAGFGSYKAHNSFATGSVGGKGDTRSTGGGILARVDMTDTALKGLYAEASFRLGGLFSDYNSSDLRDMAGNRASYDMNSTYYGAHAGLGYIWNFTDKAALDVYAKYFWTHQTGQDVTILGDKFSFKDMDSQRVRLGGRFSYAVTEGFAPYAGAAWEHEFDGKARATTYGLDVPAPSLKGSTGVGELGISWKPTNATGFSVDLGVQGFIGQREGVSGNLMLKYEF